MTYPNLYHLRYFVDAVELESVSAAARKNFVSHPTVSQGIRSLEAQTGLELLKHRKKVLEITPAGRAFADKARLLLESAGRLSEPRVEGEVTGNVSLGLSRSLAQDFLIPLLLPLSRNYPGIRLDVNLAPSNELGERLLRGSVDLSVTVGEQKLATLRSTLLKHGDFVLISPVSGRRKAEDFDAGLPFILSEPRPETEALKKAFQKRFGAPLPLAFQVASWHLIARLVSEGLGHGLVPELALGEGSPKGLRVTRPSWYRSGFEVYLNEARDRPKNPAVTVVRDLLVKAVGKA
jgi:DNA-binding transcriptional LysR family regulator